MAGVSGEVVVRRPIPVVGAGVRSTGAAGLLVQKRLTTAPGKRSNGALTWIAQQSDPE